MLTKILLTLSLFFSLTACKNLPKDFPKWPDKEVKYQYMLEIVPVDDIYQLYCWRYPIVSSNPWKIGKKEAMNDPMACNHIGGFLPNQVTHVIAFNDLFYMWLDRHFKKEHKK